jgi:hypothetical protein
MESAFALNKLSGLRAQLSANPEGVEAQLASSLEKAMASIEKIPTAEIISLENYRQTRNNT